MTSLKTQLGLALLAFVIEGCTDGRQAPSVAPKSVVNMPPTSQLVPAAEVKFDNQDTSALEMVIQNQYMYITGRPFGFSIWGISNQESPVLLSAASDRIQAFAPSGRWVVDWYASGALTMLGNFAFMSGTMGLSAINISQTSVPVEAGRYPPVDPNTLSATQDLGYVYSAMASHPTLPIIYGLQRTNYMYTLSVGSSGVNLGSKYAYASGSICCVMGATVYGGALFAAFQDHLAYYILGSDGTPGAAAAFADLQVVNVASTSRYLYLQHEPAYGGSNGRVFPRGVYVFDQNGNNVAYFQMDNAVKFAVSADDTHIYANFDNTSIRILRMMWTNKQ